MSKPLHTDDLKIYRRHLVNCTRFTTPGEKKPPTYKPTNPKERKADTCQCPILVLGYLHNERREKNGKLHLRRVNVSLGTSNWQEAERSVYALYERGAVEDSNPVKIQQPDPTTITIQYAIQRYLKCRTAEEGSTNPLDASTLRKYDNLLNKRLLTFCKEQNVTNISILNSKNFCDEFVLSWRQQRRKIGDVLAHTTRENWLANFKTFVSYCVEQSWLAKSGAKSIKTNVKRKRLVNAQIDDENTDRHGLELHEYAQMLAAPRSEYLSDAENAETLALTELMRWTGMRVSDAWKFHDGEIRRDTSGVGYVANFIQEKTGSRCVVPIPNHVLQQLQALPGKMINARKRFCTCPYSTLRERVVALAVRAQKIKPFTHHFSPHTLRHTFAIQHLNHSVEIGVVSAWLGHENVTTTLKHYSRWIKSSHERAEEMSRHATAKMLAEMAATSS